MNCLTFLNEVFTCVLIWSNLLPGMLKNKLVFFLCFCFAKNLQRLLNISGVYFIGAAHKSSALRNNMKQIHSGVPPVPLAFVRCLLFSWPYVWYWGPKVEKTLTFNQFAF